ncbi:hypothetical protein RN001_001652 [Aquatica leii]|uniref:Uncharacterized protein n=1 Tax=Aquatica leii TaxID=1421715 RepID=A0AAN7PNV0_9COLE|nr:hypothetical protein RN001_001652 [Aquatica leii]
MTESLNPPNQPAEPESLPSCSYMLDRPEDSKNIEVQVVDSYVTRTPVIDDDTNSTVISIICDDTVYVFVHLINMDEAAFRDFFDYLKYVEEIGDEEMRVELLPKRYIRDSENSLEFFEANEFQRRYRFTKEATVHILFPLVDAGLRKLNNRGLPFPPMLQLIICLRYYATCSFQTVCGDLSFSQEEWQRRCAHSKKCEEDFLSREAVIEAVTEQLIVSVTNTDSGDDWEDESESELSGIEEL